MSRYTRSYVQRDWDGQRRLIVVQDASPGKIEVATGFTYDEYDEGSLFDLNTGIRGDDLIQSIMDSAWAEGFRPRGFGDIKNETEALKSHLSDMKTVAFHLLKIKQG